ncbi:MAG: DUF5320 domain-containing protein [Chloroflexi bacterium]|nr:DUF5320 domain-containing protein [Chloroflexota bacterium]
MAQVRASMQENRRAALDQGLQPGQFVLADYPDEPTSGDYDPKLYAHLGQVNRPHQILGVRRSMRPSFLTKLPLVGSIWRRIQREGHDLVIFYVNTLATGGVDFQRHVAGVLNQLVNWRQAKDTEIELLKEEIKTLKERLDILEARK